MFASEEEALAAAEVAYREYLAVTDAIGQAGGADLERLRPLVTPEQFERELEGLGSLSGTGQRTTGASTFDSVRLQHYQGAPVEVGLYLCIDVTSVRFLDREGNDITPNDRQDRVPLSVEFIGAGSELLLANSDVWTGEDFCA